MDGLGSPIGYLHHYKKVDVLLTWVYVSRNWYQTDRNWSLNQDQVKKIKIFWSQKFVTKKTAKNGIFGRFWPIFGTITCKLPVVQSWNFAPKFGLIDWTCTGKKKNSSISARHPKLPKIQNFVSYCVTLVSIAPSFFKRMTPNCLGWLLTTSEQPTECFRTVQGTKILEKIKF